MNNHERRNADGLEGRAESEYTAVHEFIERHAALNPQQTAVVFNQTEISYQTLNHRANGLARYLRESGVVDGARVGVSMAKSIDAVVVFVAVLKAGGLYVPIDREYPMDRIRFILDDADVAFLVSDHVTAADAPDFKGLLFEHNAAFLKADEYGIENPNYRVALTDPSYVIYTSGTTGRPKGSVLTHRTLINLIQWQTDDRGNEGLLRVAQFASFSFDVSVQELCYSLMNGYILYVVPPDIRQSTPDYVDFIVRNRIHTLFVTTSMLDLLTGALSDSKPESLALSEVFVSGETLKTTRNIRRFFVEYPSVRLINQYGPSEAHVMLSYTLCENAVEWIDFPPLGQTIAGFDVQVLNEERQPVDVGEVGELYISGIGLSRGYINRPELTAERFIANPFSDAPDHDLLYQTGDLVKLMPDGNLYHMGRSDCQVKIRGFRIELEEIEQVLDDYAGVKQSVVLVRGGQTDPGDVDGSSISQYLVAYYVSDAPLDPVPLRTHLESKLPEYMVPRFLVHVTEMPLTANKKIDRRKLLSIEIEYDEHYVAPRNELEEKITDVWADVLGLPHDAIGVESSFFQLGGNSISALKLLNGLRTALSCKISISVFYRHDTIAALTDYVKEHGEDQVEIAPQVFARPEDQVLSSAQERLWFIEKFEEGTCIYNIPIAYQLEPGTDVGLLTESIRKVVGRHEVLRSVIREDAEGHTYQFVRGGEPLVVEDKRLEDCAELDAELKKDSRYVFNLWEECPIRITFYTLPENRAYMLILFHHIASDGWSIDIFAREVRQFYHFLAARGQGGRQLLAVPDLKIQYKDYAFWQRRSQKSDALKEQLNFWVDKLHNHQVLNLTTDRKTPKRVDYRGAAVGFELEDDVALALREVASRWEVSLFSVLISCFSLMLRVYGKQDDMVIGIPVSNRHYHEVKELIGFFANTLALRINVDPSLSVETFVKALNHDVVDAQGHQDLPFETLVENLKVKKDIGKHPLFQVMFGMQNFADDLFGIRGRRSDAEKDPLFEPYRDHIPLYDTAKFDLTAFVNDDGHRLTGVFNYAVALFDEDTVIAYMDTYKQLLTEFSLIAGDAERADRHLDNLSYLSAEKCRRITVDWNGPGPMRSCNRMLNDLIDRQVECAGDSAAVVFNEVSLSYSELNDRASRLGAYLAEHFKLKKNDFVALYLEPSEYVCVAILAVLKTGAAYVPIDLRYPDDRVAYILGDTKASVVLTDVRSEDRLAFVEDNVAVLSIDSDELQDKLRGDTRGFPHIESDPDSLAYVIYTSGSTGKPKGVMVPHKSVAAFCETENYCDINSNSIVAGTSSYAFDGSVFDMFVTWSRGATLVLIDKATLLDRERLQEVIQARCIDTMFLTSALFSNYSDYGEDNPLLSIETVLFGGENISAEKVHNFFAHNQKTNLVHVYGPTECVVYSTYCPLNPGNAERMPIGKRLSDKTLYVLDEKLRILPIGAVGELYIGGTALARGYLNQPELDRDRFISNPFQTSEERNNGVNDRLYKTGDLVRRLPDGDLQYIGRNDFQVKIRGYRVELGDIEESLQKFPGVKKAIVLAKGEGEHKYLVAYLLVQPALTAVEAQRARFRKIFDFLKQILPEYMIPMRFAFLTDIPLNTSGKIDRNVLLELPENSLEETGEAAEPLNHYEAVLSKVWRTVLNRETVHVTDNFFDIGGNSLLLARMHSSLPAEIKEKIRIVDLFKYPTIAMISKHLGGDDTDGGAVPEVECVRPVENPFSGRDDDIAIIGLAGRFPGADSIDEFWDILSEGKETVTFYSREELLEAGVDERLLDHPHYVRAQSALRDVKGFDAEFFACPPGEARVMDPQHRIFLECAYHALEKAGYNRPEGHHDRIGLYASVGRNRYRLDHITEPGEEDPVGQYQVMLGNHPDFLCTRVAYKLNLTGPAMTVQCGCSGSLVAVHQACMAIKFGDCDVAMAGGVSLQSVDKQGYVYQPDMIASPDGRCRAFDAEANGIIGGQGVGIVVLKKLQRALADGDRVYSVIKGHAVNNDGGAKVGFTAPSIKGQTDVIRSAYASTEIPMDTVTYIEAHGTGTKLGDPIEIEALINAFGDEGRRSGSCAIGSVKSNIGHLDSASGITGLIKATLCLYHRTLVPTLHFKRSNGETDLNATPFRVNVERKEWKTDGNARRAGVSAFGVGGTNVHVVLEESRSPRAAVPANGSSQLYLVSLSAFSETSLEQMGKNLLNYLRKHQSIRLGDLALTLHTRRKRLRYVRQVVATDIEDLIAKLEDASVAPRMLGETENPVVFMFPGPGAGYSAMGVELYNRLPRFKQVVDECFAEANALNRDAIPRDFLSTCGEQQDPSTMQPALFMIEYALARYLIDCGVIPRAMIGHGPGEYVAACISGVFSLGDALQLVAERAVLMQDYSGVSKISVLLPNADASICEGFDVDAETVDDDNRLEVSGSLEGITTFVEYLQQRNVAFFPLELSHSLRARIQESALADYEAALRRIQFSPPTIPFVSSLTGIWCTPGQVMNPDYWLDHLKGTESFASGLDFLSTRDECRNGLILEVGPGQILTNIGRTCHTERAGVQFLPMMRNVEQDGGESGVLLRSLGALWANGVDLNWSDVYQNNEQWIDLPDYPFDRTPHWVSRHEPQEATGDPRPEPLPPDAALQSDGAGPPDAVDRRAELIAIWSELLGFDDIAGDDDFFDLGGDSLSAIRMLGMVKSTLDVEVTLQDLNASATLDALLKRIAPELVPEASLPDPERWSSVIVNLRDGDESKPPLFLIHPIGGYLLCYRELIGTLKGSFPIYGVQCPYLEQPSPTAALGSIEAIASYYVEAIKSIQPSGPYSIVGASLGGLIGSEMARHITRNDEQVAVLGMIDTINPGHSLSDMQDVNRILLNIIRLFDNQTSISAEEFARLSDARKTELLIRAMQIEGLSLERQQQVFRQIMTYCEAIGNYQASPFDGRMIYFDALDRFSVYEQFRLSQTWEGLAKDGMEAHDIPGDHFSLLMRPNLNKMVKILEEYIEKCEECRPSLA